ncbi:MAG: cytochrome c [Elusimicrobia bacterium]|nr:cytochrome c [Elusimicrobiota bacterium]
MRLKIERIVLICAIAGLSACQSQQTEPAARGEAYFNSYGCVKCHAMGDKGGTYGPNLSFIGFRKSKDWLDMWLRNPHSWRPQTVMPNFHLNDETRTALVAYLSTQKGQAWADSGRPWNHPELKGDSVKRGEVLFNMAGCVACHSQNGRGGYPNNNVAGGQIPSLAKVFETYTKPELVNKIRGGVVPAPADPGAPLPMINMPKWGEVLKDEEISAVTDFLISLKPKGGAAKKDDW